LVNKRLSVLLLVFFIVGLLISSGCSAARKPAPTDEPIPNRTRADEVDTARAQHITSEINQVNGVQKAMVVVAGRNAYVGLDVKPGLKEEQVHELENIVADQIKGTEEAINTVYVSSDPDFVSRIQKVSQGIAKGDSVTRYADELSDLGRRIKPRTI